MHFRTMLSGTLGLLLASGSAIAVPYHGGASFSALIGEPFKKEQHRDAQIILAQASDPRVMQLEEQVRSLNGKIEELNFQILQMQEQIRKMQEDNEFRLQELEKKAGIAGGGNRNVAEAPPADGTSTADAEIPAASPGASAGEPSAAGEGTGTPPRTFGTITVDKDGNVTASTIEPPVDLLPGEAQSPESGSVVAALPRTDDPEELYRNSYQFILSGDYANAEAGFRDHIARFPSDAKTADASYWLGEALLGQQKYRDAAEVFLSASKAHPKAKKAPDMLLKLGVSLAGLNQKDVACATFAEVGKRYPNASDALKQRVKQEQALAAC